MVLSHHATAPTTHTMDSHAPLLTTLLTPGQGHSDSTSWLQLTEASYQRALAATRPRMKREQTKRQKEAEEKTEQNHQVQAAPVVPPLATVLAAAPVALASSPERLPPSQTSTERASYELEENQPEPFQHARPASVTRALNRVIVSLQGRPHRAPTQPLTLNAATLQAHAAALAKRSMPVEQFLHASAITLSQLSTGQRMLLAARSRSTSSFGSKASSKASSKTASRNSSVSPSRKSSTGCTAGSKKGTEYNREPWYIKTLQRLHKEFRALSREAQVALTKEQCQSNNI